MTPPADYSHSVKRVVLPSGRAIEVVYFQRSEPAVAKVAGTRELQVCPDCECDLVYPAEWQQAHSTQWEVRLRCPNCEWAEVAIFDQETVDRFDLELDRGTEQLIRNLKRLVQTNMHDELERFSKALRADAIWPMDF